MTNRSIDGISAPTDKAIDKYKFHLSILLIQKHLILLDFLCNNKQVIRYKYDTKVFKCLIITL